MQFTVLSLTTTNNNNNNNDDDNNNKKIYIITRILVRAHYICLNYQLYFYFFYNNAINFYNMYYEKITDVHKMF